MGCTALYNRVIDVQLEEVGVRSVGVRQTLNYPHKSDGVENNVCEQQPLSEENPGG